MTQLSLKAQAVLDAFAKSCDGEYIDGEWQQNDVGKLATALRAVADQVVPITKTPWGSTLVPVLTAQESREKILAIATELEAL
jgi:hypothetical protein